MLSKSIFTITLLASTVSAQQAMITTGQYDNYRTGANLKENDLSVSNVNPTQFGKLGSYTVDGSVFAQPLYVSNVHVGRGQPTDLLFVVTMHNTVFAFDANQPGSLPIWQRTLANSVPAKLAGTCPDYNLGTEAGILSTPVIDLNSNTLYAVYATPTGAGAYAHYIAALDIATGADKFGSPNKITATVNGTGYDADTEGHVSLNEATYLQRPALTLTKGTVYTAFASCGPDPNPYHGWVIGYSAANLQLQTTVFNATPNGERGGIWQGGRGLVADNSGALYAETGNGTNSATDVSNSVIKLRPVDANPAGSLLGSFTPPDYQALDEADLDLSSTGPLYIPSRNLLLASGKQGVVYVLNPSLNGAAIQSFQATSPCDDTYEFNGCHKVFSTVFWDNANNPLLYVWGSKDTLRSYRLVNGQFNTVPDSVGPFSSDYPSGILALSANGNQPNTGILWATTGDAVLHAFEATNVAHELYNTSMNSARDGLASVGRFAVPTVAAGKVFVATASGQISVYGLLPR